MSGEDAPRPYLENLIVLEIKTNKQTVYVLDRVLQPVGARCHIRRIDSQQHEAETYHLVWNKLFLTRHPEPHSMGVFRHWVVACDCVIVGGVRVRMMHAGR
jgi:hypothetical protein